MCDGRVDQCGVDQRQERWLEGDGRKGNKDQGDTQGVSARWALGTCSRGLRIRALALDVGEQLGSEMPTESQGHRGVQSQAGCSRGACGHWGSHSRPQR